jgi:hypothetical protein
VISEKSIVSLSGQACDQDSCTQICEPVLCLMQTSPPGAVTVLLTCNVRAGPQAKLLRAEEAFARSHSRQRHRPGEQSGEKDTMEGSPPVRVTVRLRGQNQG